MYLANCALNILSDWKVHKLPDESITERNFRRVISTPNSLSFSVFPLVLLLLRPLESLFLLPHPFQTNSSTKEERPAMELVSYPTFSFFPSFSLPDVLCDSTDLIWREGTTFGAITGRTVPSSDGLLAKVFWGFLQLWGKCQEICAQPPGSFDYHPYH